MGKINLLPKSVYNRISAGEVVERPSSVVKELFENAVDAGARDIFISIERGGIDEIFVLDNGLGIEKDDIPKAFLPHATSKISVAEDLDDIRTLGFRGEALASIAAVSVCKITSKTKSEEIGYTLVCEGGSFGSVTESPCNDGTSVLVKNLFFNVPARLKFLKTPKSEENDVSSTIEKLILANPDVSVRYVADGKLVFQSFGGGIEDAVLSVYGKDTIDNCYYVESSSNGITVKGYLGGTNYFKPNRTYQTIIVNGRWVVDNTVSLSVHNAYSNYLMKRQYPFYVLSVTVPPEILDVNVHPRKAEVRFSNNQIVYGTIYSLVTKVLDGSASALNVVKKAPEEKKGFIQNKIVDETLMSSRPVDSFSALKSEGKPYVMPEEAYFKKNAANDFAKKKLDDYVFPEVPIKKKTKVADEARDIRDFFDTGSEEDRGSSEIDDVFKENKAYIEKIERERRSAEQLSVPTDAPVKYVGQILNTFLVLECGDDMILIDQHAAHERFLYDKFYEAVKTNGVVKQSLLYPYAFRVNPREFDILYDEMQYFRNIGIDIEAADDNLFKVYSVPVELVDIDYDAFFGDVLSDEKFKNEKIPTALTEKLMQKACKSAIKEGYELSRSEIDSLLSQLKNDWGLKCPHGRPVAVRISRTEIYKWFKRIV